MHNPFKCRMCGVCCHGEGGITVQDDELKRIARFLNISGEKFLRDFCENRNKKLYIKTGESGACIFFKDSTGCGIQSVKPAVCYQWPFYIAILQDEYNWRTAQEACPGINRDCRHGDFVKQGEKQLNDYKFNGKWR